MIRRLVALVSVATLVAWSALPQVHIHVGEGSDSRDHAEGIIHAHWSAHQDIDTTVTLKDGRGHRLLVDQQATLPPDSSNSTPPAIVVVLRTVDAPLLPRRGPRRGTDAATRDGPPRGLALLRAPPVVA